MKVTNKPAEGATLVTLANVNVDAKTIETFISEYKPQAYQVEMLGQTTPKPGQTAGFERVRIEFTGDEPEMNRVFARVIEFAIPSVMLVNGQIADSGELEYADTDEPEAEETKPVKPSLEVWLTTQPATVKNATQAKKQEAYNKAMAVLA